MSKYLSGVAVPFPILGAGRLGDLYLTFGNKPCESPSSSDNICSLVFAECFLAHDSQYIVKQNTGCVI